MTPDPSRATQQGASRLARPHVLLLAPLLGALLLAACGRGPEPGGRSAPGPRNVLLVVIDTLRADHLGSHGYARPTTPHLDALAERGALFRQAIAQSSWTRPSMATLMTGLYPTTTGLTCHNFRMPEGACDVLRAPLVTLAELLARAGYRTAGAVANINVDPVFGFDQGFEHYVCIPARLAAEDPNWRQNNEWLSGSTRGVTDEGLAWLDQESSEDAPFFLYLHYLDPHEPYDPPAPHADRFAADSYAEVARDHRANAARYDAEIQFVDTELGRVLARLDELGLSETTAVVVVSDHGEEFGEHGGAYHGWTLFDEQTRVPLLVVAPGAIPSRTAVDEQVRVLDVAPTVLELLGLGTPDWMQGTSLVGLAHGRREAPRPALSERAYVPLSSYRQPPWKLVHDHATGQSALYDLAADPGELHDVSAREPDVTATLLSAFLALRARAEREAQAFAGGDEDIELTPEQIEQLRALGYEDPGSE